MKSFISVVIVYFLALFNTSLLAQDQNKVTITGVRFAYPLVEKWIEEYKRANPSAQIEITPRSSKDPAQYDLLIEAYEPDEAIKESRDFLHIARYALRCNVPHGFCA